MAESEGHPLSPNPDTYQYKTLEGTDSIRVLRLFPSKSSSSEIQTSLEPIRLNQDPEYEALSYSWAAEDGDYTHSRTITCDGAQMKITKNCEAALRRLRKQDSERALWVDAICINQGDMDERNHQVGLMGSIYTHATLVLIWLGDNPETANEGTGPPVSVLFLEHLAQMAAELQQSKDEGQEEPSSPLYTELICQVSDYVSSGTLTPLTQGFLDVTRRPWWDRIWVVQEAALAQSAVIVCGGHEAKYSDFYNFFVRLQPDCSHESGLTWASLDGFKHHMSSVWLAKERTKEVGPNRALRRVFGRSRRLSATNRKDHVFGLLGILNAVDSGMELPSPDYNKSTPEVFTDMTIRFLRFLGTLDILSQATNVDDVLDIPSWVTNWSKRPQLHIPSNDGYYHASGNSEACYTTSDDGKELQVLGKSVDMLDTVTKVDSGSYRYPYIASKGILGYQESCRVGFSMKKYPTGENIEEVVWRTLIWNLDELFRCPAAPEVGTYFKEFHRILVSGKETEVMERELLEEAAGYNDIAVHSMPMCITANGFLASVPWTATAGDRVVVLAGGELPFILRPSPTGNHYRLMGACYVHGIMDGEAFPEDPNDLEWFSIR